MGLPVSIGGIPATLGGLPMSDSGGCTCCAGCPPCPDCSSCAYTTMTISGLVGTCAALNGVYSIPNGGCFFAFSVFPLPSGAGGSANLTLSCFCGVGTLTIVANNVGGGGSFGQTFQGANTPLGQCWPANWTCPAVATIHNDCPGQTATVVFA